MAESPLFRRLGQKAVELLSDSVPPAAAPLTDAFKSEPPAEPASSTEFDGNFYGQLRAAPLQHRSKIDGDIITAVVEAPSDAYRFEARNIYATPFRREAKQGPGI